MEVNATISTGYGHGGRRPAAGRKAGQEGIVSLGTRERLVAAKADREEHLAALAKLELAEREGRLLWADQVSKSANRAGMTIRDGMLSVPGRIAARLVGIDDEREIERLLTEEIRAELTRLARSVTPDAA